MSKWKTACKSDRRLLKAMQILFSNHLNLLAFVFDENEPRLRRSPEELLSESNALSGGEQTLVRVAIDLWSEYPCSQLSDIVARLEADNFYQVLKTLMFLGPKPVNAVVSFDDN